MKSDELCEIHSDSCCFNSNKKYLEDQNIFSDFTISAIMFATFCLFVEAALVILKNRELLLAKKFVSQ